MKLLGRATIISGIAVTTLHIPLLGVCLTITFLLVYFTLLLPAVFFRDKERRKDARAALRLLLKFLRHPGH